MSDQLKKLTKIVENDPQTPNFQDQETEEKALESWIESLEEKDFIERVTGES